MLQRLRRIFRVSGALACGLPLATAATADARTTVMCIGDSLTREYAIMATDFPSPDSNPGVANTMNWVEILAARRGSQYDFGHYATQGHDYNYAIPGYETVQWTDIIEATPFSDPARYYIRYRMRQDYNEVDVVVVMLGGNDLRANYGDLYDPAPGDITPAAFKSGVITNLGKIIDEIRGVNGSVPIVLADVPDLSIAPDIIADHPDPVKRAGVSAIVNQLNQEVAALAATRGVTLAQVSQLSDLLLGGGPVYIGAIEMINDKDPTRENRPRYLFCKGGLHPGRSS